MVENEIRMMAESKEEEMGLRINTNVPALSAQRAVGITNKELSSTLGKLSTGSRINKSADDAAGLAISEKLKAQLRGNRQANRNAGDGISLIQTAEGGLNEISSMLTRLRELSIQAATDTVGDPERGFTNMEYQNLKQEIQRIAQVTEFNGKKLLNGEGDKYDFQIGLNNDQFEDRIAFDAQVSNATLDSLSMSELDVATKEGAQNSLGVLDAAISKVSGERAFLGATQNRLSSTMNNLDVMHENMSEANSRIRDTDYAEETSKNVRLNIRNNAGASVLSQANQMGSVALKLLG